MIDYKQEIQNLLDMMLADYQSAKENVAKSPKEDLFIMKNNDRYRISSISYKKGQKKIVGISQDEDKIIALYNKAYSEAVLNTLYPNIQITKKLLAHFEDCNLPALQKKMPKNTEYAVNTISCFSNEKSIQPDYSDSIAPESLLADIPIFDIDSWVHSPYRANSKYKESLIIKTVDSFYVRSKSESLIYDIYKKNSIAVHYDQVFVDSSDSFISPDFVIVTKSGKLIYHEHWGIMNKPEYQETFFSKMRRYINAGILPGKNLISTYDSPLGGIDSELIEKTILSAISNIENGIYHNNGIY